MILCIDSGNSRIKWDWHDGQSWRGIVAVDHQNRAKMAGLLAGAPNPDKVMLANVAGAEAGAAICAALGPWQARLVEVASSAAAGGVTNGYAQPARLGVDRWCALIGARALQTGPCVVVMAGTATTVDALDGEGHFLGGLILPGYELMRRSLARDTAALPLAAGQHALWPNCTDDAIVTGCLEAQAGAIERFARRMGGGAICLLSGGAAAAIAPHLDLPCRAVDNLVLEGLHQLAGSTAAGGGNG